MRSTNEVKALVDLQIAEISDNNVYQIVTNALRYILFDIAKLEHRNPVCYTKENNIEYIICDEDIYSNVKYLDIQLN